jgi:membrane associated rhomboid family serine protease
MRRNQFVLSLPLSRLFPSPICFKSSLTQTLVMPQERFLADLGSSTYSPRLLCVLPAQLKSGRWSALLLSPSISHAGLFHLAFNLMTLVSLGYPVQQTLQLSKWPLWPYYSVVLAGSFSYYSLKWWWGLYRTVSRHAFLAVQAQLYPKTSWHFDSWELFRSVYKRRSVTSLAGFGVCGDFVEREEMGGGVPIAHSAHLGGLLFGIAYHAAWLRQRDVGRLLHRTERIFKQNNSS